MAPVSSSTDFPIGNVTGDAPMRPIPLTTLLSFHGSLLKTLIRSSSNLILFFKDMAI